jgi:hypothetical protein
MRRDIWIFLFALGGALFTWPIMSIFRNSLPWYLFLAWLGFIVLTFLATIISEKEEGGG